MHYYVLIVDSSLDKMFTSVMLEQYHTVYSHSDLRTNVSISGTILQCTISWYADFFLRTKSNCCLLTIYQHLRRMSYVTLTNTCQIKTKINQLHASFCNKVMYLPSSAIKFFLIETN